MSFSIVNEQSSAVSLLPVGAFSWRGMFSTAYWADTKEKIIGLIYKSIWPATHADLNDKFKVLVYQAIND